MTSNLSYLSLFDQLPFPSLLENCNGEIVKLNAAMMGWLRVSSSEIPSSFLLTDIIEPSQREDFMQRRHEQRSADHFELHAVLRREHNASSKEKLNFTRLYDEQQQMSGTLISILPPVSD